VSLLSRLNTPAFSAGGVPPDPDPQRWELAVTGLVSQPRRFSLAELKKMPQTTVDARLTSVSGFSVRAPWQGVLWRHFLAQLSPDPEATHATFVSYGRNYTTTVSLADLDHPRVLLCYAVGGEPLEVTYGGPLRMFIPHLYGYKSAKWLVEVEFTDRMRGGYWEDRGFSRQARIEPGEVLDVNTGQRRRITGGEVTEF
jgi:DMSO/TMAO reductase YedYZ molybdopterin-dependent catalytic subunit